MKTFATSIFVPSKTKKELPLSKAEELTQRLNNQHFAHNTHFGEGALDDVKEDEEFVVMVNSDYERHEIHLKGTNKVGGKLRLMVKNPTLPEVRRFLEWRLDRSKVMSCNRGSMLQLKNFTTEDLRRLMRHAIANQERTLVTYR